MIIGIAVYDKVDLLDVAGPREVLSWMDANTEIRLIARQPGPITTRDGLTMIAPHGFADTPQLDVLWVPGGDIDALRTMMVGSGRDYLEFFKSQSANAKYVCSVCEGALLLAQAGLLDGYEVTTHWAFIPCLGRFPNIRVAPGTPRFVLDRNRLTGGGISSGIDEALKLVELLTSYENAQEVQRVMQYYPDPPVTSTLTPAQQCPFSW
ncbi:DJ-1/PfpI family protein [Bradyrhizobium tropiciagri]|uniref:DJ-1/PfpI family protein n=1 Tax=Bradyrhizobium tropiciagri TaxID=312253 RepID=UPI001BA92FDF|nr:DJ-1/PfpI family protein [Bradyrhizobium tropiciagri]MBR0872160.1 DJ-1/PfpI family protein [Bradyrhizobium tropiciagri]